MNRHLFFLCATICLLVCLRTLAIPMSMYTSDILELSVFPHLVCIADFICTGTPVSTNDGCSAVFSFDELLWGKANGTNVVIRHLYPQNGIDVKLGEQYLVVAFTNNWWSREEEAYDDIYYTLSHCIMATNRPPQTTQSLTIIG